MAGGWKLNFMFRFVEVTHESLHLDKLSFVRQKIIEIPTNFICVLVLFDEGFKYDNDEKFWGYVGTGVEPLCVQFCNLVQCLIFTNYLTCY
jgi:hypothetical protein